MNGYKYMLSDTSITLSERDYVLNGDERFFQQFYVKQIKIGADEDEVYIYRESNPFGQKFLFNSKMFRMSKKWSNNG